MTLISLRSTTATSTKMCSLTIASVRDRGFDSRYGLMMDACEKSLSTLCRKSWVFSGFFPQGKLTGWVRINIVRKVISQLL
jgi:hypothetical protein